MRSPERRTALTASVPPLASLWIWRRVEAEIERSADAFESRGKESVARELRFALAQLKAAAAQVETSDLLPRIGSVEVVGSEMAAGSESASLQTMSVAEVADGLKVTGRRVRQLIASGDLAATQRAAGAAWRVDRRSVERYRDLRRTA